MKFQTSTFQKKKQKFKKKNKILKFENTKFEISKFKIFIISKFRNSNLQMFELHGSASILKYQKT